MYSWQQSGAVLAWWASKACETRPPVEVVGDADAQLAQDAQAALGAGNRLCPAFTTSGLAIAGPTSASGLAIGRDSSCSLRTTGRLRASSRSWAYECPHTQTQLSVSECQSQLGLSKSWKTWILSSGVEDLACRPLICSGWQCVQHKPAARQRTLTVLQGGESRAEGGCRRIGLASGWVAGCGVQGGGQ